LAEREEELAARRLDALLRLLEVFDLEAEVMRADEALGVLQSRARFALVFEEREIDHAVAEIDRRAHVDVLLADALELEHTLVEARRALEIAHDNGNVAELGHGSSIGLSGAVASFRSATLVVRDIARPPGARLAAPREREQREAGGARGDGGCQRD